MFILWIKFVERIGEMDGSIGEIDVENIADGLEVFGEGKLLTIACDNLSGIEERSEDTDDVNFLEFTAKGQVGGILVFGFGSEQLFTDFHHVTHVATGLGGVIVKDFKDVGGIDFNDGIELICN